MYVAAFSEKSTEMFLIELPKSKSQEVLVTFRSDYNHLCDNLDIQKGRLVILNPNRKKKKKVRNSSGLNQNDGA